MVRKWQPREMRMVAEYLAQNYPRDQYITRVRLGKIQPRINGQFISDEEALMMGSWRRWADALVIKPDRLILIEAAIRPNPGDISQLELYKRLLPHTPELAEHAEKPIDMVLLYSLHDPLLEQLALERGIKILYYRPQWVDEYLKDLLPRERRAPHTPL